MPTKKNGGKLVDWGPNKKKGRVSAGGRGKICTR